MFTMTLETVGNPDHGQYEAVSPKVKIKGRTFKEILSKVEDFMDLYSVGGGNWVAPALYEGKNLVGFMSYNRRIWETRGWPSTEVVMG